MRPTLNGWKSARTQAKDRDATSVGILCGAGVITRGFSSMCAGSVLGTQFLTQRLCWGCDIILKHLAEVRRRLLVDRYDAD